jgi:hypothetical protein
MVEHRKPSIEPSVEHPRPHNYGVALKELAPSLSIWGELSILIWYPVEYGNTSTPGVSTGHRSECSWAAVKQIQTFLVQYPALTS